MVSKKIPIIDLFAGPGGLGEGFSSIKDSGGNRVFDIRVSIEKDPIAHSTLSLRALYRKLAEKDKTNGYYEYIRGDISRDEFLSDTRIAEELLQVSEEARCATLGETPSSEVDGWIKKAIDGQDPWVLIGGPPCQAYSIAGRSRMRGADPEAFEEDKRHFLYKEYLRIIQEFKPTVFVMENVKGILSSMNKGESIFDRILEDLSRPAKDLEYEIRSFVTATSSGVLDPQDFVIRTENYGVPQARHRVILLGVRKDFTEKKHNLLKIQNKTVSVRTALCGLPKIRSRLSKEPDSHQVWVDTLKSTPKELGNWQPSKRLKIKAMMEKAALKSENIENTGVPFKSCQIKMSTKMPITLAKWLHDPFLGGVCGHESRGHMRSDLQRYMFAACYSAVMGNAPKLEDFPKSLLPNHKNINDNSVPFGDRFRVQIASLPAKTIVSHIAKDGHYYIHFDAAQCRSFSVREAARIQTFPDNYFFVGTRTQQYTQIGNAVPPYLAKQLGEIVAAFLRSEKK